MTSASAPRKPNVILTPDRHLRVFISSTLKELAKEREIARQSVLKMRLLPVMFEAGARPHPARELYQAYLAQSHIFIGIYWQSYGWVGPGMEISGLEDEFNLSSHLARLIYVKSPAPDREPGLQRMLSRLQQEDGASYKHFSSSAELGELIENDLALLLSESYEAASRAEEAALTPGPLTNIPFPRNPLLGRSRELETVCSWLSQASIGLVTLTGAGGAGKSRLAIEAALQLRDQFSQGVYLVRLTPVRDPDRVIPTIAETLELREAAQGRPVEEMLTNYLRGRQVLLVLDNFEQVLGAAPRVADLLEACPRLKVLTTSRAPLRVRGEKELLIQPLPVPNPKEAYPTGQLSQYASVDLFIQRAQGVRSGFRVTNENAPAVAEICYRLDGLPLAIELAAARIRLLSPQELLVRLTHRFEVLRGGTRDLPERQQTLRGAIDWSYDLLTEPARAVFRRLSVFAGGFSIEAAESVCSLDDIPTTSVLEQIETLVDFSLLTPVEGLEGRQRFGMLESIRDYAFERLIESGEVSRVRRLHAEFFLRFARDVEPHIRTSERARWRSTLQQDLENIRGVLDWALTRSEGLEAGQSLTFALTFFWALCGVMSEGLDYCRRFLDLTNETTPLPVRAGLLTLAGAISMLQGRDAHSSTDWQEGIPLARQSGEKQVLANALLVGGGRALAGNDPVLAAQRLEECELLYRELGDEWGESVSVLWQRNSALLRGDPQRAAQLFDRGLSLARNQGDPWLLVVPLSNVAQDAIAQGELEKAESTLLELVSTMRTTADLWTMCWPLTALAQIQLQRGQLDSARVYISEALQVGGEQGNVMAQTYSLVETAALLVLHYAREGTDQQLLQAKLLNAARLCGASAAFVSFPHLLGSTLTKDVYDAMIAQVHRAVSAENWEKGYGEGTRMPLEQAVELATSELQQAAA